MTGDHQPAIYPLEWRVPEGTTSGHATNLVVQQGQHEFFLSFYEVAPPILFGPPPEGAPPPKVYAELLCRVAIAHERIPDFIQVMQQSYDRLKPEGATGQEEPG